MFSWGECIPKDNRCGVGNMTHNATACLDEFNQTVSQHFCLHIPKVTKECFLVCNGWYSLFVKKKHLITKMKIVVWEFSTLIDRLHLDTPCQERLYEVELSTERAGGIFKVSDKTTKILQSMFTKTVLSMVLSHDNLKFKKFGQYSMGFLFHVSVFRYLTMM